VPAQQAGWWQPARGGAPNPKEAKLRYIEPFAPHAHPERFSDSAHVEKFFKLNCTMVLKRECTPLEKGDLITWLMTIE